MDTDSVVFFYNHLNLLNVHLSVETQTHNLSLLRSQLPPHLLHLSHHKNITQTHQTVAYKAKRRSRYTLLMVNIAHQNVHTQAALMRPLVFVELHLVVTVITKWQRIIAAFFATQDMQGNVM